MNVNKLFALFINADNLLYFAVNVDSIANVKAAMLPEIRIALCFINKFIKPSRNEFQLFFSHRKTNIASIMFSYNNQKANP